jgi:uncharacterized protein YbaR (Trm112 family)
MKKDIMNLLCCPCCKSTLDLSIEKQDNDDVIKGLLKCTNCDKVYCIHDGIPNFIDDVS